MIFTEEQTKVYVAFVLAYEASNLINQVLEDNKTLVLKYPDGRFTKLGKELAVASVKLEHCMDRMFPDDFTLTDGNFLNNTAHMAGLLVIELCNDKIEKELEEQKITLNQTDNEKI